MEVGSLGEEVAGASRLAVQAASPVGEEPQTSMALEPILMELGGALPASMEVEVLAMVQACGSILEPVSTMIAGKTTARPVTVAVVLTTRDGASLVMVDTNSSEAFKVGGMCEDLR